MPSPPKTLRRKDSLALVENALLYSRNERIATVFQGISKFGRFTAKKAFKLFSFTARATCAVSDIVAQKTVRISAFDGLRGDLISSFSRRWSYLHWRT